MKKIIAAAALLAAYKFATAIKAEAWFTATHEDITSKAIALLEKEGKAKQVQFFKPYRQEIMAGCTEPDTDGDIDKGEGMHYYSISTPKCKELPQTAGYYRNRSGKFSKSARTMMEENYTSALCLYKSGRPEEAMHVLARAAHFIEDMCCTVHVSNVEYIDKPTNLHNAYEKNINNTFSKYTADRFDKRLLKSYEGDTFENASNKLIKAAARFLPKIAELDPLAFAEAAGTTLPMAQQNVMALMLRFYDDCQAERDNYITDGKKYTFKNEKCGLVMTVTDKGVILDKPDKQKEQKLTAVIQHHGAFGFKAEDTGYLNEKCKGFDYLKRDAVPALFRLAALGKKRFRIMAGGTRFEKAVGITKSGLITLIDFDPADKGQIWVLS
ncbi:MAG: phospholipase [Ruminococcus sp.]|nr:phospholipase [Ruminococcus sp.]